MRGRRAGQPRAVVRAAARFACCVLGAAFALGAPSSSAGTACHRGFQNVDRVANYPGRPAWGDFDEDGRVDIAVTWMDDRTTVLLNRGNEVFEPGAYAVAPGGSGYSIAATIEAVSDLDGDGHLDLVYRWYNRIWARFGDGHGNFGDFVASPTAPDSAQWRVADVTGDGRVDFVDLDRYEIRVLKGQADGTFALATTIPVTDMHRADQVPFAVGDLDGDGKVDIVDAPNAVHVFWNEGDLQFTHSGVALPAQPTQLAVFDVDGDGRVELVATEPGQLTIAGFHGRQVVANAIPVDGLPALRPIGVGDLDGDGHLDLVLADGATVAVFWGTGPAQFSAPTYFAVPGAIGKVAVLDVDGDGVADVAASLWVLHGKRGSRELDAPRLYPSGLPGFPQAVAADIDGDGNLDVVAAERDYGQGRVLFGDGRGGFRLGPSLGVIGLPVALVDLDGDGHLDLAANSVLGFPPKIWYGDGTGRFEGGSPVGDTESFVGSAQLSGGGNAALVAMKGRDLQLIRVAADRTLSVSTIRTLPSPAMGVVVADIDGDGASDIVVGDNTGTMRTIIQSAGGWSTGSEISCQTCFYEWIRMFVGDLDGDGRADLIASVTGAEVFLQGADGSFTWADHFDTPVSSAQIALSDVDGDGRPDVIVPSFNTNGSDYSLFIVDRNDGTGTFRPYGAANAATGSAVVVGTTDMDGDGWPDLILATGEGIEVLRNVCESPRIRATLTPAAPRPGQAATFLVYALPAAYNYVGPLGIYQESTLVHSGQPWDAVVKWSSPPLPAGENDFLFTYDDPCFGTRDLGLTVWAGRYSRRRVSHP